MLDIVLFLEYLNGKTLSSHEFVGDEYSPLFGNEVTCTVYNSTADVCHEYVKYNYWYSILTLSFVYLPSVNVIATLYGPETAGRVGILMSLCTAVIGGVFALIGYFLSSPATSIIGWFVIILSSGILAMGLANRTSTKRDYGEPSILHYIMFIPLVTISPVILIAIKFLAIFKSGNTFLQSQATYGSRGEGILEAAPQLGLQLYIILLSLDWTTNQVLSILTSAATLSLPNISNFVVARGGKFGFKTIIKNVWVFFPASLFKILSASILGVFLRGWGILIIVGVCTLMFATLYITTVYGNLPYEEDDYQQFFELVLLSWLTVAGLGKGKWAAVLRLESTLLITIIYTIILGTIMVISNVDANCTYLSGAGLSWIDLAIVKDPFYLNLLLGSTIGLGWLAFMVDFVITWCKAHDWRSHNWGPLKKIVDWFVDPLDQEAGFWDEAVLLQGLGFRKGV